MTRTEPAVPDERSPATTGAVAVVGLTGGSFDGLGADARRALAGAAVVLGVPRHLEGLRRWRDASGDRPGSPDPAVVELGGDVDDACRRAAAAATDGRDVCVLVSGDPGFFGIVRSLLRVVDRRRLRVHPAPSSVSLAFARLGLPWDDAAVVSAHGRPLADAVRAVRTARKAAVLTTEDAPPEALGRALVAARAVVDLAAVCSRVGHHDEQVTVVSLHQLATGTWDPRSVVVLLGPSGRPMAGWGGAGTGTAPLAWGLPDAAHGVGDGVVTSAEVRAVALGKLALPPVGVLWDVGSGSGSVAVEAASLCPGLTVFALEERGDAAARISENAARHGVDVRVVHGPTPSACEGLPDPDRVFVGGGGLDVLDVALARLRPGGRVVAAFAALDRAVGAADRLGELVQVTLSRGRSAPEGTWQLVAADPVFVAWGPRGADGDPGQPPEGRRDPDPG